MTPEAAVLVSSPTVGRSPGVAEPAAWAALRVSHDDMRFHGAGCTCPTRIPRKVGSDVAAIAVFLTTAAITTSRGFTDDRQALVQHSPEQTQRVSPLSSAAAVFVVRRINSGPSDGRRPCGPCLPGDPLLILC